MSKTAPGKNNSETEPFNCEQCQRTFSSQEALDQHSRNAHSGMKPQAERESTQEQNKPQAAERSRDFTR